jgi:hypothetical protein
MIVRLSTLTTGELVAIEANLGSASLTLRMLGHYPAATVARAVQRECAQHLLRRQADMRQNIARQMSLTPPGAYEAPDER